MKNLADGGREGTLTKIWYDLIRLIEKTRNGNSTTVLLFLVTYWFITKLSLV